MKRTIPYLAGGAIALGYLLGGTTASVLCGWIAAFSLSWLLARTAHGAYRDLFIVGVISHAIGFYWLLNTIKAFGGFPWALAAFFFAVFVGVSALAFPLAGYLTRSMRAHTPLPLLLCTTLAWTVSEFLPLGIFPWGLAHTQISFSHFVQIADLGGATLVTFVMMLIASSLLATPRKATFAAALLVAVLIYGEVTIRYFNTLVTPVISTALVQENISLDDKHDIMAFESNVEAYRETTSRIASRSRLVIWPETVIQDFVYAGIGHRSRDARLPSFSPPTPLIAGALTFDHQGPPEQPQRMFNSALTIQADGSVPSPYNKQVLMPFGEYIPMESIFPFLRLILPTVGDFTPGSGPTVFSIPIETTQGTVEAKVAPLICYEDIVPSLARSAVQAGATLLVNLTNDAWFGDTHAPLEHHIIASFRAIETRRYLLRSTNSGLTAVVSPIGKTTSQLKTFSKGTILADVNLISYKSWYTAYVGDSIWWIASALVLLLGLTNALRRPT